MSIEAASRDQKRLASRAFMPYPTVALAAARHGPLAGLSFAVKDLFDVAGYPTSGGQPMLLAMSGIKTCSSPVVTQLLDAGAQFVGKTITDELAFSINGQNAHFGDPINPHAPDRISGGSSSGSASAVAHGLCDIGIGSDTGGSVRAPANHCGLIGIRTSHGLVSLEHAVAFAPSLDSCGWFASDIDVFIKASEVLLQAPFCQTALLGPINKPRWMLGSDWWSALAPEVGKAHQAAMQGIGNAIEQAGQALLSFDIDFPAFGATRLDDLVLAFRQIQGFEAWQCDGALIQDYALSLGPGVAERFAWASQVSEADYIKASKLREAFANWMQGQLADDGLLIVPTMPDVAPLRQADSASLDQYRASAMRMLCVAGLCRLPQINLPLSRRLGAPLGLSLIGPAGSDLALLPWAKFLMQAGTRLDHAAP
jgi:amidase